MTEKRTHQHDKCLGNLCMKAFFMPHLLLALNKSLLNEVNKHSMKYRHFTKFLDRQIFVETRIFRRVLGDETAHFHKISATGDLVKLRLEVGGGVL